MSKIEKLRNEIAGTADGILVTSPYNRRYMTNFTGSAGAVLISAEKAVFITDFRYTEQAEKQAEGYEVVTHKQPIIKEIADQCEKLGIKKLGIESDHLVLSTYKQYEEHIHAELIPLSGTIEKLRLIKSADEIKIIKEAADIADAAFKHILDFIQPGRTEIEVSNELEFFMRNAGAVSSSFDIIVASGTRSALPHGVASSKTIEKGDFVTLDYGALHKGYASDMTRTLAVGEPDEKLKEIYQVTLDAQLKAMEEIKPGLTGKEADAIARDYITSKGYGEYFGHSLGHGLGMEVHEGPGLSSRSETKLKTNMVVTVEPGIYLPGIGGVRIEDDTVITENGNETLTHSTKDLIIL
ncbi:M24 family metallopeptidase [Jeotgalibacillus malaysiensis]|uniref:M24 family metallopeptidase n=1 Tax=Jeotgalibacillus malaysiensis TaxID=1508404 RepID=UPI00384FEF3B